MKKGWAYLYCLILLCLIDSTRAQNYLPLEIGNRWDFNNYFKDSLGIIRQEESTTVIATMDSTMPNGKTYYLLEGQGSYLSGWVRTDTSWLFRYDDTDSAEYAYLNFNAQYSDTFYNNKIYEVITLIKKDTLNLFNHATISLTFNLQLGLDNIIETSFSDKYGFLGGSYYYFGEINSSQLSGCIIGDSSYGTILSAEQPLSNIFDGYILHQNYPNPFNPSTTIYFSIPEGQIVDLSIYDLLGRKIITLVKGYKQAGGYTVKFECSNLSSGIYLYQMRAEKFMQTKKLIVLK